MKNWDDYTRQRHFARKLFKEILSIQIVPNYGQNKIENFCYAIHKEGGYERYKNSNHIIEIYIPTTKFNNQLINYSILLEDIVDTFRDGITFYLEDNWDASHESLLVENEIACFSFMVILPSLNKMMFYKSFKKIRKKRVLRLS